jgi:hypothetical protein
MTNPSAGASAPIDRQQTVDPIRKAGAAIRPQRANAGAQDEHDPGQAGTVRPARSAAFGLGRLRRQERRNLPPQLITNQGCNHARPTTAGPSGSVLMGGLIRRAHRTRLFGRLRDWQRLRTRYHR